MQGLIWDFDSVIYYKINQKEGNKMHHGVYIGKAAAKETRILILGESHHNIEGQGKPAFYTTSSVVETYLAEDKTEKAHRFFHKIAQAFGVDTTKSDEKEKFWDKIYFGNYIDVVCGVKDSAAKKIIKDKEKRKKYNKELFQFVNENKIDIICCFSRLVYNHLPNRASFENKSIPFEVPKTGGKRDWIEKFIYKPGTRANGDIALDKKLTVYSLRHPSAACGFCPEHYKDYLQKEIRL